jgi:murein tripeptide amidase MpaA
MPAIDFSRFHCYAELVALLKSFAAERPDVVAYSEIGTSHEGRAIPLLTLTRFATGKAEDKPAYWVDGNIHSVELSATSACLYFVDWLLKHDGKDANVTRQLDTRTLYVAPRLNPDGAEWALADRPKYVRSSTRRYPFDEEPVDGLITEDIDGDGRILQMRVRDPNGPWKPHPQHPQLMIRRDPLDAPGGDYYRVMPEGTLTHYDGVTLEIAGVTGSAQGLDLNRNFPAGWRQEFEQLGAGPFPTSEPEVRAVVEFFTAHPNLCGGTSIHTFSVVLLRPLGHAADNEMISEDLWTYQTIGRKGEALTGYPAISVWEEFRYHPKEHISGTFDWIYEHLGLYTWTIEIWNPKKEAGIDNSEWVHWFRDHPPEDDVKVYEWALRVAPADSAHPGHVAWRPLRHPQLGDVEIGGWNRMAVFTNPPPPLREKEIARFPQWLLWTSLVSPKLELRTVEVTPHGTDTWKVRLVVQNSGWLPT